MAHRGSDMAASDVLSVRISAEMVRLVREKVAAGEYASESEVVEEALGAWTSGEPSLDVWLHDEVAPTYDRMRADPSRSITLERVRDTLARTAERVRGES